MFSAILATASSEKRSGIEQLMAGVMAGDPVSIASLAVLVVFTGTLTWVRLRRFSR